MADSGCSSDTVPKDRIIIYAWVNDEKTMRKSGGRSDLYAIFSSRLRNGELPDDWDALIKAAAPLGIIRE